MSALAQKLSVPLKGTEREVKTNLLFISNTADEKERQYVFGNSTEDFRFWQDIQLGDEVIGTLAAVNCIAEDFEDTASQLKSVRKILALVESGIQQGFINFVFGASTKYAIKSSRDRFAKYTNLEYMSGNGLTGLAVSLQEQRFLNLNETVLIMGGSTHLAKINARILSQFMPKDKIRPNARGDAERLQDKFAKTPFNPISLDEIRNGFKVKQMINCIHYPLLTQEDLEHLGIELCLEGARPTVYGDTCKHAGIDWYQLGTFKSLDLKWKRPLWDIGQGAIFACFLEGIMHARYGDLPVDRLLRLARADGFKLEHVD